MRTRTLVGEGEAMGVDWVWQVGKYIVGLSPRDPCRAVIGTGALRRGQFIT